MKMERYENVKRILKILDLKIYNQLKEEDMNLDKISDLVELRGIYLSEYEGLQKSLQINNTFNKKYGYKG